MASCPMRGVYEAAGGDAGILRLAEAWHARVLVDPVVSHAFSHGFQPDHTQRLAAYWAEALGGPQAYTGSFGYETFVVRLHSGNGEHDGMDRRAIACFDRARVGRGRHPVSDSNGQRRRQASGLQKTVRAFTQPASGFRRIAQPNRAVFDKPFPCIGTRLTRLTCPTASLSIG